MEVLQKVCLVFTILGGIVWGLIGIMEWNLVEAVFGTSMMARIIYSIVGLSALINIRTLFLDFRENDNVTRNNRNV